MNEESRIIPSYLQPETNFTMKAKIHFITLGVKNIDTMKTFYQNVFGWEPLKDSDGIVFFKLNGFILSLYPDYELAEDINITNDGDGFKRFSLSINFNSREEVDNAFNDLTQKGAAIVRKPEAVFWGGYRGYVCDPENNYWELAHNPFLSFDTSGNVASHE